MCSLSPPSRSLHARSCPGGCCSALQHGVRQQPPEVGPQSLEAPSRSRRCVPIHPTPRSGRLTHRRIPSTRHIHQTLAGNMGTSRRTSLPGDGCPHVPISIPPLRSNPPDTVVGPAKSSLDPGSPAPVLSVSASPRASRSAAPPPASSARSTRSRLRLRHRSATGLTELN